MYSVCILLWTGDLRRHWEHHAGLPGLPHYSQGTWYQNTWNVSTIGYKVCIVSCVCVCVCVCVWVSVCVSVFAHVFLCICLCAVVADICYVVADIYVYHVFVQHEMLETIHYLVCVCVVLFFWGVFVLVWGGFFFCVPHHFWVRFLRIRPFFNPTIKVVTFRLGVFLLPAFTRLGHERQDLLSPCDEMHVCTD